MSLINAMDKPLFEASSNLPDVSAAVMGLLYPVIFEKIQTTLVDGRAQKVPIKIKTQASVQPFTAQMLKIKPEGQRNWSWFTIHALEDLILENNDRIKIDGVRYKIMEKSNWVRNHYVEYNAILDYQEGDNVSR